MLSVVTFSVFLPSLTRSWVVWVHPSEPQQPSRVTQRQMHFHSGQYVLRGLRVGIDVSHPAEHYWNPQATRLLASLFGVDAPLWPKLRMWTKQLVWRQVSRSAAEVHMPMP